MEAPGRVGVAPAPSPHVSLGSAGAPSPSAWDPRFLSPYQQVARVLELGLVQHPLVTHILQLTGRPPCRPEMEEVLEEMLTFWHPSLQLLWGKGSENPMVQIQAKVGQSLLEQYRTTSTVTSISDVLELSPLEGMT